MRRAERERKKMGNTCMILTIILVLFHVSSSSSSSSSSHNACPPESFHVYIPMEKVSEEANEQGSVLDHFRVLLGLRSFHLRRRSTGGQHGRVLSPLPSPSPSPSPSSVAPVSRVHGHGLDSFPRPRRVNGDEKVKFEGKGKGKGKRVVLVAVLVAVASAVLLCAVVFFLFAWRKRKRQQRKPRIRVSVSYRKSERRPSTTNKVSLNPALDFLYLESLSKDLDQQSQQAQSCATHSEALLERVCDASSSSTREIASVNGDVESVNDEYSCEKLSSKGRVFPVEERRFSRSIEDKDEDDDGDESFHSFGESCSPNPVSLSNASLGSFCDALETLSFNSTEANKYPAYPPPPPPPPPPPLAPPRAGFLPTRPPPCSAQRIGAKASTSFVSPKASDVASLPRNITKPMCPETLPRAPTPPCPPPPSKLHVPPPPAPFAPMGKDGCALPKLKPLHWDKVRASPDQCMVWDKIGSSSFELDEEMIESLFGYHIRNSMKNEEYKSKTPSPSKHVLEPKRLQNLTILSKALNVTSHHVCLAILQGNGLSAQQLEALVKMVPTKEEEAKLSSYHGNDDELGSPERLVKAMLNVPFAFERVEGMLFRETFDDEVVHLHNSFSMLQEACNELRSSRLFLKLLEAVLKTGNRMNVGTIRGGATAFKLDALLKLADVKGTDGKTSLLHFVVQELVRSESARRSPTPDEEDDDYRSTGLGIVAGIGAELGNVKKTAAADLDVLATSVSGLAEGAGRLRRLVDGLGEEDGFAAAMRGFVEGAEARLAELRGEEEGVMARVKEVTEYFHGSVVVKEEANPLRIFVIVRDFLGMLENVCKELRSSKTPRSPNPLAPFR